MKHSVNGSALGSQPQALDRLTTVRTKALDHDALSVLRGALTDKGWTLDAISAHMGGKDLSYIRKVLAGEKPMPAGFLDDLPHDAKGLFYARQAEAHGLLVVEPVDLDTARRNVVSGLVALLAPALPIKASRMAHVEPSSKKEKVG